MHEPNGPVILDQLKNLYERIIQLGKTIYNLALTTIDELLTYTEISGPVNLLNYAPDKLKTFFLVTTKSNVFQQFFVLFYPDPSTSVPNVLAFSEILDEININLEINLFVNWLNCIVENANILNTFSFVQPFSFLNNEIFNEYVIQAYPHNYSIVLPDYITNFKSLRLLSTEIPNTISNVTPANNIVFLNIIKNLKISGVTFTAECTPLNVWLPNSNVSFDIVLPVNGTYDKNGFITWVNANNTDPLFVANGFQLGNMPGEEFRLTADTPFTIDFSDPAYNNSRTPLILGCTYKRYFSKNNVIIFSYQTQELKLTQEQIRKLYNYNLIKLDVGFYTVETLCAHIQSKFNGILNDIAPPLQNIEFIVNFNKATGVISIKLSDPFYAFHMKFNSILLTTGSKVLYNESNLKIDLEPIYISELWYKLGFPRPALVDSLSLDVYTNELTNCVTLLHPNLYKTTQNDIFYNEPLNSTGNNIVDTILGNAGLLDTGGQIVQEKIIANKDHIYLRPYKYPDLSIRYIYLCIKGFKTMKEKLNKNLDLFAKILLNVPHGQIAYNSYVNNPFVYLYTNQTKISKLDIQWVDEFGEEIDFMGTDHSFTLEFIEYVHNIDVNKYGVQNGTIDTTSYPEYIVSHSSPP
jgi:hypothetical protein